MDTKEKKARGRRITPPKDSDIFLKKHVGLIHCENKLSLIQRKICNILLFNALDNIKDQEIHEISLRQLCSLVGYNSNDSKLIKQSIKTLISVVMEWNLLEDDHVLDEGDYSEDVITWNASSLLAGASIKSGLIRYSYSPQIKSILTSLDIYGRINLFVQSKFNSMYSLVLYENCVRFKNINHTAWFPLKLFRSLVGVSEDKYPTFKEFKRNVINVAVKEINEKSDIYIEPQFKKSGRSISAIQFSISENERYRPSFRKAQRLELETDTKHHSSLIDILTAEYQLSNRQACDIIDEFDNTYILQKMHLVKAKKNIKHRGAYLISALKKDYQEQEVKSIKQENTVENSYLRLAKQASEIGPLKNKYISYKLKIYLDFIQQQSKNIEVAIYEKFAEYLQPNIEIFKLYKKKRLSSPFVMTEFLRFIENKFPHIIGKYLTFDDFITSEEIVF